MTTPFEAYVNAELPHRVASSSLAPVEGYVPVATGVGTGVDWVPPGLLSTSLTNLPSIAALRALTGSAYGINAVWTTGYYAGTVIGGSLYLWDAASTAADTGLGVIAPTGVPTGRWIRAHTGGGVSIYCAGAKGDGSTDDLTAWNTCSDYCFDTGFAMYLPAGNYKLSGTGRLNSKVTYYGDGISSIVTQNTVDAPVLASAGYYTHATSPTGHCHIRNLWVVGGTGSSNHGILLRDYYSSITDVLVSSTGGDGVRVWAKNSAGTNVSGTLVENRLTRVVASSIAGYGFYLGEDDNNKITDGYINDCIVRSTATTPSHIRIGSAAGWQLKGIHTYGTSAPTSHSINLVNSYHTTVSDIYIEGFGGHGINAAKTQRALSFSNIHVKNDVAGAAAIRIDKSSLVSSCEVTVNGLCVVNSSANAVVGISTLNAAVTVRVSGAVSFTNIGGGSITKYSPTGAGVITRVSDAIVDNALRETANGVALMHRGYALPWVIEKNFVASNPAVVVTLQFTIDKLAAYNAVVGTLHINSRSNYNGVRRCKYMGQVYIQAKLTTDAWQVVLDDIIAPSGFTVAPAVSVTNSADGTGTLTVTFTPNDTDGYGSVALFLTPGETQ